MAQGLVLSKNVRWVSGIGNVVFPWRGEQDKLWQIFEWRILDLRFERSQRQGPGSWYMNDSSSLRLGASDRTKRAVPSKAAAEKRGSPQCISSSCVSPSPRKARATDGMTPSRDLSLSGGDEEG